jgi:chromatin modification-related protein VID21
VVHDTHGQYNKMPKLTPQELGRMKAEKDYHEHLARQRTEELRVKTAREQQVRIQQGAQNSVCTGIVAANMCHFNFCSQMV